jgi:hypothetical protein
MYICMYVCMYVFLCTFSIFPFKRYTHQLLRGKRNNQSRRQIVGCNARFYLRYINVISIVGLIGAILGIGIGCFQKNNFHTT